MDNIGYFASCDYCMTAYNYPYTNIQTARLGPVKPFVERESCKMPRGRAHAGSLENGAATRSKVYRKELRTPTPYYTSWREFGYHLERIPSICASIVVGNNA